MKESGLWYPRGKYFSLIAHIDSNWESDVDDQKSTSGGPFFLRECLVSWLSKKQVCISLSIAKEKYIAPASCCTRLLWMK